MCNQEPFELSKAMKTMIQIQQNRFKSTIDDKPINKDNSNYNSTIEEILSRQCNKKDESYRDSNIDADMLMNSHGTIMPTMATLSYSTKLENSRKKYKTMATLLGEDCVEKEHDIDVNAEATICGDDNISQWLNNNLKNKTKTKSKRLNNNKHGCCNDIVTLDSLHQKSNDDIMSTTSDSIIDESSGCHTPIEKTTNSSCRTNSITSSKEHYYDILQCKQRLKHEKCDIHGVDLKMVCPYPTNKFSNQNRIKQEIIQRYGACNTFAKDKSLKNKKLTNSKSKPICQQSARIAKVMSKEEQVFQNYKALGHAKRAQNHLNEYDSDMFFSKEQRNIPMKFRRVKVKDQELHKMIDDIMI